MRCPRRSKSNYVKDGFSRGISGISGKVAITTTLV